ncbi:MAG TPA: CBS domain-containing protein [Mycobacterium sp.]|jgi:CBS domain-containing protein|nr:CBS domain-containing protein [Mycobacterium sp.]
MIESSHPTEPNPVIVHQEAAAASVRHLGPTGDRYHNAMVRYLNAIAGEAARPHSSAPKRRAPATLVGNVMTRAVIAAHEDAVFKEIVAALARNRVSALPVIDDARKVVGVVSETDLMAHMALMAGGVLRGHSERLTATRKKAHASTAAELMSSPAVTTRPHATIVEAARVAAQAGVRHLPVVDSEGVLVGIVSRSDLLRVFLREDDEIRDEIEQYARHAMRLDSSAFTIDVTDGVVTLAGKLERALQMGKLVNHVRGVSGVVDVHNQLTARFDDRYFPAPRDAR